MITALSPSPELVFGEPLSPFFPRRVARQADARPRARSASAIWEVFVAQKWRLVLTYVLIFGENVFRLLQPLVMGWAITGVVDGSLAGLAILCIHFAVQTLIGLARRMYDSRTFARIHAEIATRTVVSQRSQGEDVSSVASRSGLCRTFVKFLDRDVPVIATTFFLTFGAVVVLGTRDWRYIPLCLVVGTAATVANLWFGGRIRRLNGDLHDEFEHEVDVVREARPAHVLEHFQRIGRCRTRLSDTEAYSYGVTQVVVLVLLFISLGSLCDVGVAGVGAVYAIYRYVTMFADGLNELPMIASKLARFTEIRQRLALDG